MKAKRDNGHFDILVGQILLIVAAFSGIIGGILIGANMN